MRMYSSSALEYWGANIQVGQQVLIQPPMFDEEAELKQQLGDTPTGEQLADLYEQSDNSIPATVSEIADKRLVLDNGYVFEQARNSWTWVTVKDNDLHWRTVLVPDDYDRAVAQRATAIGFEVERAGQYLQRGYVLSEHSREFLLSALALFPPKS